MTSPALTIHNPIFYDLGVSFERSLESFQQCHQLIAKAFPRWVRQDQQFEFQAYNFSYLALHLPPLVYQVDRQSLAIQGIDVSVELNVVIRSSGNVCFFYQYQIDTLQPESLDVVVDILQRYTNVAYKEYLKRIGAYKNAMQNILITEDDLVVPDIFEHGDILVSLRDIANSTHNADPQDYVYQYQHGRLLFSCDPDNAALKAKLLDDIFLNSSKRLCNEQIFLGTWKTVLLAEPSVQRVFLDLYTESLSRFFQCQGWIFQCEHRLDEIKQNIDQQEHNYKRLNQQAKDIESFYFSCNRDMINFLNLSIPYKDEHYTQLADAIIDAIKLEQHIQQTYQHLNAVKEHINLAKLHIDSRTEKHAKLLKLLMALNLSAGIASLIPASLDGDISKFSSSMLPPIVWMTFALIAVVVLIVETRHRDT